MRCLLNGQKPVSRCYVRIGNRWLRVYKNNNMHFTIPTYKYETIYCIRHKTLLNVVGLE